MSSSASVDKQQTDGHLASFRATNAVDVTVCKTSEEEQYFMQLEFQMKKVKQLERELKAKDELIREQDAKIQTLAQSHTDLKNELDILKHNKPKPSGPHQPVNNQGAFVQQAQVPQQQQRVMMMQRPGIPMVMSNPHMNPQMMQQNMRQQMQHQMMQQQKQIMMQQNPTAMQKQMLMQQQQNQQRMMQMQMMHQQRMPPNQMPPNAHMNNRAFNADGSSDSSRTGTSANFRLNTAAKEFVPGA